LPQQQSARKLHDPSDKYRKRGGSTQSILQGWLLSALLVAALFGTIIFSMIRYNSLSSRFEALQKKGTDRNRYGDPDKDRMRKLEKELMEVRRSMTAREAEKKKLEQDLAKAQKDLYEHQNDHHHTPPLTDEQRNLLDPDHQKYLEDREAEFLKSYNALTSYIQEESRREVLNWLGAGPFKVKFTIEYPEDRKPLPENARKPVRAFVVELADLDTMPHSVHIFLEQVAGQLWDNTAFIINPGHVLQAAAVSGDGTVADRAKLEPFIQSRLRNVAFQEYNQTYPHERWTLGFAGRPGGPDFYINTANNTLPHGPGGQKHHELTDDADPCFGKVVDGLAVIKDMMNRPVKRNLLVRRITIKKVEIVEPILQHDPHEYHELEQEEIDEAELKARQQTIPTSRNRQTNEEDEPEEVPEYINHDKGFNTQEIK